LLLLLLLAIGKGRRQLLSLSSVRVACGVWCVCAWCCLVLLPAGPGCWLLAGAGASASASGHQAVASGQWPVAWCALVLLVLVLVRYYL
jgi:hypothetical protein